MSKPAICSLVSANGPSAASTSPARTRIVVRQSSFERARALAQQTRWPGAARPRSCDALVRSLATSSANALIIIGCIMTSFGLVIASTSTRRMNSTKRTPSRPGRQVRSRGSGSYLGARVGSFIRACIVTPFADQNDAPSTPDEDATSRKRKAPRVFTTPCESLTCCLRYDKRTVTGSRAVADQHTAR